MIFDFEIDYINKRALSSGIEVFIDEVTDGAEPIFGGYFRVYNSDRLFSATIEGLTQDLADELRNLREDDIFLFSKTIAKIASSIGDKFSIEIWDTVV